MIQMFDVCKVYPNNRTALTDINLHIHKGELTFLTGQSGAGKTTLIKLIFCAEKATRGQTIVNGINLTKIRKSRIPHLRRSIGVVFQDFKLLNSRSAYENVVFALEVTGTKRSEVKRKAWLALKLVGLHNRLDATPLELSGGEQQRIAIARAIVNDPTILLADEPTGNLDADITQDIMELFQNINNRGTTVLIATHNRTLAQHFATRHITLEGGRIVNQE
jgi:cell division transport system ATP-binding protein